VPRAYAFLDSLTSRTVCDERKAMMTRGAAAKDSRFICLPVLRQNLGRRASG
jgi:hypothetical protein